MGLLGVRARVLIIPRPVVVTVRIPLSYIRRYEVVATVWYLFLQSAA